jgi:hypothetical protein
MARGLSDYVALAMISDIDWNPDDDFFKVGQEHFDGDFSELKSYADKKAGFRVSDSILEQAVRTLASCGLLRITDDNFSGTFVKIKPDRFEKFIEKAHAEIESATKNSDEEGIFLRPSDYPNASALYAHELLDDYSELGDKWLKRALEGIRQKISEDGSVLEDGSSEPSIPGSDRLVTLSHNQIESLDEPTSEIITAIELENAIPDHPGLRELIIGQLRAGRELIRIGVFKAELLQMTIVVGLKMLVEKYGGHAIGALASKLLDLICNEIGIG